jgi:hypothetical protein
MRPWVAWVSIENIRKTLDNTTQLAKAVFNYPLMRHLASRFKLLNRIRLRERVLTDTIGCQPSIGEIGEITRDGDPLEPMDQEDLGKVSMQNMKIPRNIPEYFFGLELVAAWIDTDIAMEFRYIIRMMGFVLELELLELAYLELEIVELEI